jgi:hypothetical protein
MNIDEVKIGNDCELTPGTLASQLATLPKNTANTAYSISLKVSSVEEFPIIRKALRREPIKYVKLDLTGSTVTSIGEWSFAFSYCNSLVSITIPDSVTSIGKSAFYHCTKLTSVKIGSGVISIGKQAFSRCRNLTNVTIPDSVTSLEFGTFEDCTSLTSVTIPDGITCIGERAFYHCKNLVSIIIPDSVTSIGDYAFYGCIYLTSLTFQGTISSSKFRDDAFLGNLRDVFYLTDSTIVK